MQKPLVLITGASGFIGSHLIPFLLTRGYEVIALSRRAQGGTQGVNWVTEFEHIGNKHIDYVINLAGESIGQGRWSAARKQKLIESRVSTTHKLYSYLSQHQIFPKVIISGSAVGYYGIDPAQDWQQVCDEDSPSQDIFMSELCQKWEYSALQFSQFNTKIIRLGIVFGKKKGILPQMLLPIKLGLVGKIGTGQQPVAWVHIQDVLRAIEFLMQTQTQQRIFNLVAPELTHQAGFVEHAAQQLGKKPLFNAPAWLFQALLGEQAQLILNGQYVKPMHLTEAGFTFDFPSLPQALQNLHEKKVS